MPVADREPFRSYNFKVLLSNNIEAHFMQCTGLHVNIQTIDYRESGNAQVVRKLPGRVEYDPIVLRYGLTGSDVMWNWFTEVVSGKLEPKNITIQLLDNAGSSVKMVWNLINAWPREWKGAELDALSNHIAIETLVLNFEGIERKAGEIATSAI